ncbi:hypothetical protein [Streptomyces halobius]|uniref:Uncharacterized protein n=1 Tax=Streptomyces halobius TaxID=2879846 RepID=A0ABY4M0G3_9ACTN|nr:hypothetical protein [Streptomyces halobius]UQA91250.1 hypothetical protein K9S39_04595 [Streptomyces halobius]
MEIVKAPEALSLAQQEEKDDRPGVVLFGGRSTRKTPLKTPARVTVEQATDAKGVILFKHEDGSVVDRVKTGTQVWIAKVPPEFVKVCSPADLLALSRAAVPFDAHDAKDSGVTFEWVDGNASGHGFWPEMETGKPYGTILESHLLIKQHGVPVGAVNTCWLLKVVLGAAAGEENEQSE